MLLSPVFQTRGSEALRTTPLAPSSKASTMSCMRGVSMMTTTPKAGGCEEKCIESSRFKAHSIKRMSGFKDCMSARAARVSEAAPTTWKWASDSNCLRRSVRKDDWTAATTIRTELESGCDGTGWGCIGNLENFKNKSKGKSKTKMTRGPCKPYSTSCRPDRDLPHHSGQSQARVCAPRESAPLR